MRDFLEERGQSNQHEANPEATVPIKRQHKPKVSGRSCPAFSSARLALFRSGVRQSGSLVRYRPAGCSGDSRAIAPGVFRVENFAVSRRRLPLPHGRGSVKPAIPAEPAEQAGTSKTSRTQQSQREPAEPTKTSRTQRNQQNPPKPAEPAERAEPGVTGPRPSGSGTDTVITKMPQCDRIVREVRYTVDVIELNPLRPPFPSGSADCPLQTKKF